MGAVERKMGGRRAFVLYPFLLAAFPALAMFAHNVWEVLLSRLWAPLLASCALAGILLAACWAILRDIHKAGLLSSAMLVVFFSYGHVYELLSGEGGRGSSRSLDAFLLSLGGLLLLLAGYGIARTRRDVSAMTKPFNVVAVLLLAPSLAMIAPAVVSRPRALRAVRRAIAIPTPDAAEAERRSSPDIYYIILDRYAGEHALRETYRFDNREFWEFLRSRGFYVAYDSNANYPRTLVSLASSLNMCHLTEISRVVGRRCRDQTLIYHLLQDHAVGRFLKSQGYKYVHLGPGYEPTASSVIADVDGGQPHVEVGEFAAVFLRTTLLRPLLRHLKIVRERDEDHRDHIMYQLKRLPELAEIPGPKFVFGHILLPHQPYIFGPNGEPVDQRMLIQNEDPLAGYLGQLQFTNKQMEKVVDELLSRSEGDPVIILQADEGGPGAPGTHGGTGDDDEAASAGPAAANTHLSILNAYRLPGVPASELYPTITPVNTFRLIFRHYFGADCPPLEDRSYTRKLGYPYWFVDVTESSRSASAPAGRAP